MRGFCFFAVPLQGEFFNVLALLQKFEVSRFQMPHHEIKLVKNNGRIVRPEKPEFVVARLTVLVPQKVVAKEVCEACGKTALCCIVVFEVTFEKTNSSKICGQCFLRMRRSLEENAPIGLLPPATLDSLSKTIEKISRM